MALDQHKCVAAILMDLSKAFNCLPHELLLVKLEAYGLSGRAVELLGSYLGDRQQRIKLGPHTSNWADLVKHAVTTLMNTYSNTGFRINLQLVHFSTSLNADLSLNHIDRYFQNYHTNVDKKPEIFNIRKKKYLQMNF